jgi:GT2 family glycosyltransferase
MVIKLFLGEYNKYLNDKNVSSPKNFLELFLFKRTPKALTPAAFDLVPLPDPGKKITDKTLNFTVENPLVSIIIPVYNKWNYTYACLRSLYENTNGVSYEVILIDDNSTDFTKELFSAIPGLVYIRNTENSGFIKSCNKGASVARGRFLCFLNNDTQVRDAWLKSLTDVFEDHENVGLAGSKLIYPNGVLQEAGGIIWNDSTGYNYGRMGSPVDPKYNYLREVDYCSGASILVEKSLFDSINGFDLRFVPAYYEDTDLCFQIRELGKKVIYQPKSEVIHFEGITSGTSLASGVKKYQKINEEKFVNKWSKVLKEKHFRPLGGKDVYKGANRLMPQKRILVIDTYVPKFDQESGSNRLFQLIRIFKSLGYQVVYLPDNGEALEPYTSLLQKEGVEVLFNFENTRTSDQLQERLEFINYAWVCRPELNKKYGELIKQINPGIKLIYDTIDLHYLRLKRELELGVTKAQPARIHWKDMMELEMNMAAQADIVITVTEKEKEIFQEQKINSVFVIPNIHEAQKVSRPFEHREGLLFIGGYDHLPNVDAVKWLVNEIMPIIWKKLPDVKVTLLGSNPPAEVLELQNEKISVPGYIHDVSPYFESHKLFVCPLRYGAGMKGKIGQSLEFGLPIISTAIGIEGMKLIEGTCFYEANDPVSFAEKVFEIYGNKAEWEKMNCACHDGIAPFSFAAVKENVKSFLGTGLN